MFTHVSVHSCTDCLISNGLKCVIGTQYYPYSKCDHLSCHILEMFICKFRNIVLKHFFRAKWDFVSRVLYTDLSLCRSAAGERTWGSWFEQTHSWFAESPACDSGAWKSRQDRISDMFWNALFCSMNEWYVKWYSSRNIIVIQSHKS